MHLSEFQLYNYKSFQDSGPIELKPGFNIITGQNNAGKTALLEGLGLRIQNKPHRSLVTHPTSAHANTKAPRAQFSISLHRSELDTFVSTTDRSLAIPYPLSRPTPSPSNPVRLYDLIIHHELKLTLGKSPGHDTPSEAGRLFGLYDRTDQYFALQKQPDNPHIRQGQLATHNARPLNHEVLDLALGEAFISNIYTFRAERLNIGLSLFGDSRELKPDASNLPEVLSNLQSNPTRFQRYNQFVKRVLPQVESVTVRAKGDRNVEIIVWSYKLDLEREDLAVPLSESGTGISQVLAMLYVLVTADVPRVLIIDEPNSFLHPGAVRSLIEIFREHPQHQYIISTHSPDLISACNPSTVHILRKQDGATVVQKVDARETKHLRSLLMEVGARLSDVFGSDSVLWVEGKTEEICFPLIVQKMLKRPLSGVSIVGVLHTGDFDSADARSAFRIYDKLTQGTALLPPAIAFIFDRELRPDKDQRDLKRQSQEKVSFLERRTYENYLLHAAALSSILNTQPGFESKRVRPEQVQTWLAEHTTKDKYYLKAKTRDPIKDVDAPRLLGDLFAALSDNTLEYNKVQHSLALTEWLLDHAPAQLQEIADLLDSKLPALTSISRA